MTKDNSVVNANQEIQQQLVQNFCYLTIAYLETNEDNDLLNSEDMRRFCFLNLPQSIRYYFGDMAI